MKHTKVDRCGKSMVVNEFIDGIERYRASMGSEVVRPSGFKITEKEAQERRERNLARSARRTKKRFKLLVRGNLDKSGVSMLTLTYAENMQDELRASKDFKAFIRKLRESNARVKYISVMEKQKRGAVHYHVLIFGKAWIGQKWLQKKWGHGYVSIKRLNGDAKTVNYLVKYLVKEEEEGQVKEVGKNKKKFHASRDCEPIRSYSGVPAEVLLTAVKKAGGKCLWSKEVETDMGRCLVSYWELDDESEPYVNLVESGLIELDLVKKGILQEIWLVEDEDSE